MNEKSPAKISAPILIALIVLTIILAQQIIDTLFPMQGIAYTLGKITVDLALVVLGLTIKKKTIGSALLFAGVIRFVLVFTQLSGMDAKVRALAIVAVVVVLFVVGYIKFGNKLGDQAQRSEVK